MKTFKEGKVLGNQYFLLGSNPKPNDKRPRNAFGILIGFGQAYSEYWAKKDEAALKTKVV